MNELDLFIAANAVTDPDERSAFLDRECAGNSQLRQRLEALLAGNEQSGHPLDHAAMAGTGSYHESKSLEGQVIAGKYTLVELIGEGGMGSVWRAKQSEPVKRFVAVKLIKAGMDSKQVLARFDAERQALALMDHPNIAKVLDGGLHGGRPFFVMELVKGAPITEHCDLLKLTPKERLELFVPVCQAIQHAHQKGIIHRDIKPTNVLVALYDDRPVVKVIDFGVAKATGGALTEATIDTGFSGVVGTPQYMSPEQATFNNLDIDTRSDVYALGVLLYELLTGSPPFSKKELEKKGLLEMLRVVREEEPPRPSTKLSSSDALPSLSACRGTEPKKLAGLLRHELDWIVMKALEKNRSRRYETANGFAADVQRYLAGEAIQAHPPSARYRLRKFVHRHRGRVVAAGLVLTALLVGVTGTTLGWIEARRQRTAALDAADKERDAKIREAARAEGETRAKEQAQKRLAQIEKSNEILSSVFTDLNIREVREGTEPLEAVLASRLLKAADQLEGEAVGDPIAVARLQDQLARALLYLGQAEAATSLFRRVLETRTRLLGAEDHDTVVAMGSLAHALMELRKLDEALPLLETSLKRMRNLLGLNHVNTLNAMGNLALAYRVAGKLDLSLPLSEEVLRLTKEVLGPKHKDTLTAMHNLAQVHQAAGDFARALPLFEESLRLRRETAGATHTDTLLNLNGLASVHFDLGNYDRALSLYEQSLKLRKESLGADHPATISSMNDLATVVRAVGRIDDALRLNEQAVKLMTARRGKDHPDTLACMTSLAVGYAAAGQADRALQLHKEVLDVRKSIDADHPETLVGMSNLATAYKEAGKLDLALPLYKETLERRKAKLGNHPQTYNSMNALAEGYRAAGKLDLALPLWQESLRFRREHLGANHPETLISLNNLGTAYETMGKVGLGLPLLIEAATGVENRRFRHQNAYNILTNLIACLERLKRYDQAEPWRRKRLTVVKERSGAESLNYTGELFELARNLCLQQKWKEAEVELTECLAVRRKIHPDAWSTFNTECLVAGTLLRQKKYAEAEPLLLKGYEGMKARQKSMPPHAKPRLGETVDHLIELYTATNKPDEVKKWKGERETYPAAAKATAAPVKNSQTKK